MIRNYIHQPYIIIGMHRSGTTFLANALNDAGIFMGALRDINGEAMHFLSLNQQMLWADDADWLMPKVPRETCDKTLPAHTIFAEHVKSTSQSPLKLRLFYCKKWGWKDPRNTFTLKYWLNQFPKAKVIHVIRDGRAVAKSLQMRNKVKGEVFDARLDDNGFNFELWEKYVAEALSWKEVLGNQYFQIKYEDLTQKNASTLQNLDMFCGVKVSRFLKPKAQEKRIFSEEINQIAAKSELYKMLGYSAI